LGYQDAEMEAGEGGEAVKNWGSRKRRENRASAAFWGGDATRQVAKNTKKGNKTEKNRPEKRHCGERGQKHNHPRSTGIGDRRETYQNTKKAWGQLDGESSRNFTNTG